MKCQVFWLLSLQEDNQNMSWFLPSKVFALKKLLFYVMNFHLLLLLSEMNLFFSQNFGCALWLYLLLCHSFQLKLKTVCFRGVKVKCEKKLKWLGPGATWFAMWILGGKKPWNETVKIPLLNTTSNKAKGLVTWLYILFRSFC